MLKVCGAVRHTYFYCAEVQDYEIIKPLLPKLAGLKIVGKNAEVVAYLRARGIQVESWPVFPKKLIMARHGFYKFPVRAITKIGLRHGPFHFKKLITAKLYNLFDCFVFTSSAELAIAQKHGIKVGVNGGYPKLDTYSDPSFISQCDALKQSCDEKPIVVFSATYEASGLSAIDKWYKHIDSLCPHYTIAVTLHPFTHSRYRKQLQQKNIFIIAPDQLYHWLYIADALVSDTSSVIAEFLPLVKPVITFTVPVAKRLTPQIDQLIQDVSYRIESFSQLPTALGIVLAQKKYKVKQIQKAISFLFDDCSSSHVQRCYKAIRPFLHS